MIQRVTTAVIGLGDFGNKHLELLSQNPLCEVVAVVDRTSAKAEAIAERFSVPRWYTTPEALFAAEIPQAVSIATAGVFHLEPALLALEHGAAVLLEKPVVMNSAEGKVLAAAEAMSSGFVMPSHVLRFAEPYRELKRRIDAGNIGTPVSFAFRRYRQRNHDARFASLHPALMTAVHDIDLALWLSGASATEVFSAEAHAPHAHQPSAVWATVQADNNTLWSFHVNWLLPDDAPALDGADVFGTTGLLSLGADGQLREYTSGRVPEVVDVAAFDLDTALASEFQHFLKCAAIGLPSSVVTLREALKGLAIAERIVSARGDWAVLS